MHPVWTRIENWLARHAPELKQDLRPGATAERIAQAERELGVALPADLRASLAIHDGQEGDAGGLFDSSYLLGLTELLGEWRGYRELLDDGTYGEDADPFEPCAGIQDVFWSPKWIPLTSIGASENDCIDLAPGPGGKVGQIIFWRDDGSRRVVAPSFEAWLSRFADELEAGAYAVEDESGLVRRE